MSTIPANAVVSVVPSVLSAGGSALDLNGLILTTSTQPPIGAILSFGSAQAVADYFGDSSDEAAQASIYFLGWNKSTKKPKTLLMAQYPEGAVSAYLRGGDISSLTEDEIQAIGTKAITITIDGYAFSNVSVNLSAATSLSNAASTIQTALATAAPTEATCSTGTIAGTVLTVAGTVTGSFAVGQTISGSSVTVGSKIISLGTGSGGAGTYNLSASSTVGSGEVITSKATAPTVTYDSVSGGMVIASGITGVVSTIGFASAALATPLKLTLTTGGVLSQGADATNPTAFMDGIIEQTQNWAAFDTIFDPDNGSGNAVKLEFSEWTNDQDNRYLYAGWDPDESPTVSDPAVESFGDLVEEAQYSGTAPVFNSPDYATFILGVTASIDFDRRNGRITYKFKAQDGLAANVTTLTAYNNLIANGYNCYGAFATANDEFIFFADGTVSGTFKWLDSYVNQIWLNNALQLALMVLLTEVNSIPYNAPGRALIQASMQDPINAGLNFGAIVAGVVLSEQQKAEINNAAGVTGAADSVVNQGYYLQILPGTAQVRGVRGSPPITLWYADGGSVHKINVASIEVQ